MLKAISDILQKEWLMSEAFTLFVSPHANPCISKVQQQTHARKCAV